jgi:hypothetical protein
VKKLFEVCRIEDVISSLGRFVDKRGGAPDEGRARQFWIDLKIRFQWKDRCERQNPAIGKQLAHLRRLCMHRDDRPMRRPQDRLGVRKLGDGLEKAREQGRSNQPACSRAPRPFPRDSIDVSRRRNGARIILTVKASTKHPKRKGRINPVRLSVVPGYVSPSSTPPGAQPEVNEAGHEREITGRF